MIVGSVVACVLTTVSYGRLYMLCKFFFFSTIKNENEKRKKKLDLRRCHCHLQKLFYVSLFLPSFS